MGKGNALSGMTARDIVSQATIKALFFVMRLTGTALFKAKARLFGATYGAGLQCWGAVHLLRHPGGVIRIGDNVRMVSDSRRCTSASIYAPVKLRTFARGAAIRIGDNVGLTGTAITARTTSVTIGNGTIIGPNCCVMDSDFHAIWPPEIRSTDPGYERDAAVRIGDNVWIGAQCIVLKGATIGDNAVIAAGSVVTGAIPPNVMAAGRPARVVKSWDGPGGADRPREDA